MYYKFLDTADADKVLIDGTMVISSLEYFRSLEANWADIGDYLEGASELTVKGNFVIRENSPELALVDNANIGLGIFQKFAIVSGGGVVDMSNVRIVHVVPKLFIYSVSVGNIDELITEMCVKSKRPYDACLRVPDLGGLQRKIFECGRIRDLNCGVNEVFLPGLIQVVEYEPRSRDIRQGPVIEPSPFKKDEKFKEQAEVRVLFVPKEQVQLSEERLIIEIPVGIARDKSTNTFSQAPVLASAWRHSSQRSDGRGEVDHGGKALIRHSPDGRRFKVYSETASGFWQA
jgi:hypothetical protein